MLYLDVRGVRVPALGLGTWQLTGPDAVRTVETALRLGYRHLDTAQSYGNEAEVGRALRQSGIGREAVFLTTKIGPGELRRADALRAADESLRRLGTDYVDLLLVHWPNPGVPLAETLDAFQQVRADGKARLIGVSNFPPSLLAEALDLVPDLACDQVEYHPFLGQDTLLELVRKHDLMLTAYSPIARGRVRNDEALQAVAAVHARSAVQVTLRWLLQQDRVAAIPKASSEAHLADNLGVFDFALSEEEMEAISELARGERLLDPDFGPDWE